MEVKGKIVIVTGASLGIGLATAELLTKQGANVILKAITSGDAEVYAHDWMKQGVVVQKHD